MVNVEKNIESFERVEIDSLKIRIPFNRVEILSDRLEVTTKEVNDVTWELLENQESTFKTMQTFPVKNKFGELLYNIRYDVKKATIKKNAPEKFLFIGVSSKLLEKKYLEGITSNNIRLIYERIISQKIASFSFEDFLNSECTDVDFKKDVRCHEFQKAKSILTKMTKAKKIGIAAKVFNQKDNSGIQWSDRRIGTPSNPYLKLYNKKVELETRSVLFYNEYIKEQGYNLSGLIRIEYTIKNKKHFRDNDIEGTRLTSLLQLTQEAKDSLLNSVVKHHLLPRLIEPTKPNTYLSPLDMMLYSLMLQLFDNTYSDKNLIIENTVKLLGAKDKKYRARKKLNHIWDTHIQTIDRTKENEEQRNLFTALCWE